MSTNCVPLAVTRKHEYFILEDAIAREVIEEDITRYLGNEATVLFGIQENPQTKEIQKGYYIDAYRNLTQAMLEDLKRDSEILEAERQHSTPVADCNRSKYCSKGNCCGTVSSPPSYPPAAPANSKWHVPRDLYEAHCGQLEKESATWMRESSWETGFEDNHSDRPSMAAEREFEYAATIPNTMPTNIQSSYCHNPYASSDFMCGNTPYDPRKLFLLNDGYGELAPISSERQYQAALDLQPQNPSDSGFTSGTPTPLKATKCNPECCDILKTFGRSGKHISRDSYPRRKPVCEPVAGVAFDDRYIETLNTNNPVSSIENSSTGLYEATLSDPLLSPVSYEFPPSAGDRYPYPNSMNVVGQNITFPQAQCRNHGAHKNEKENVEPTRPPFRVPWSPEPYPSSKLTFSKESANVHHNIANSTSLEGQEATDAQHSNRAAPSSPSPKRSDPKTTAWAALPLVPYVPPAKKDMPILLNGRYTRAHTDFWIPSSVINADFAKSIGATINFGAVCLPLKLPTLNNYIRPVGVASILLEFPQEQGGGRMMDFIVIENFVQEAVIGGPFLRTLDEVGNYLSERSEPPPETRNYPICSFLGQGNQKIKCRLGDQEIVATADPGSEVNLMSLDFATRNGFHMDAITYEDYGIIRFSNSSVQTFNNIVSLPVCFGAGAGPSRLLKLLSSASGPSLWALRTRNYPFELPDIGCSVSILVDFFVLEGLAMDVILGQAVLATARGFTGVSPDALDGNSIVSAKSDGVSPVEAIANCNSRDTGDQNRTEEESVKKQDLDEIVRYEKERERARKLQSKEKRRAERRNEKIRREYNKRRAEKGGSSGSNTLHYHLCPCKLHSLDKSN